MKVRYIPWYPAEWLDGTAEMPPDERGVYVTIVNLIYSRGGPIPDNVPDLSHRCRCHPRTLVSLLNRLIERGKVVREGAELMVNRCRVELERASKLSSEGRENGLKGGRPTKKNNELDKPMGFPVGFEHEKLTKELELKNQKLKDSPQPPSGGLSPSKAGGEASDPDSEIPAQMAKVWHEECGQVLRVPTKLNPARQKACKARWHDSFGKDLDQWRSHCRAIRHSPFLCGETDNGTRNWRADFDWALTPRAILGVAEGKYAPAPLAAAPSAQPKLRLVSDEDAEWERIENRANEIGVEFSRLVRGKQWTRDIAEARLKELQTLGLHLWRIKEIICLADDEVCETSDGLFLTSLWRAA